MTKDTKKKPAPQAVVYFRCSYKVKDWIERKARLDGRSVSKWLGMEIQKLMDTDIIRAQKH